MIAELHRAHIALIKSLRDIEETIQRRAGLKARLSATMVDNHLSVVAYSGENEICRTAVPLDEEELRKEAVKFVRAIARYTYNNVGDE